jgi:tRNA-2-methylthio-N6-dimethylallyladenosine synthase
MSKKLFIETLGCQMNTRDTEHIIAELNTHGDYIPTTNSQEADLIIINTCSVREKPVAKLFSELGQFNKTKKDGAKIGVCGCTASHLGSEIIKRAPFVDFVVGARNVSKISKAIENKGTVEIDINNDETSYEFSEYRSSPFKANINISLGCDKQCTFCIVPSTRGDEISIPSDIILNEAKKSAEAGMKEIFLLGQNVNNYGKHFSNKESEKYTFTKLLQEISKIDGIERIRFTSPHPLHMDDEFIEEFASNPKICKLIHVPLQSGSTKILKEMKRGYTKEWFLNRCEKIKSKVPNVRISTDIIVAFPGESEEDFLDTLDVVEKVKFDQIFNFKYSPRPNTPAATMEQIDSEIGTKRLQTLIDLHKTHQDEHMEKNIGTIHSVYFEDLKPNGEIMGFSDNGLQVFVKGSEELLGKIVDVEITHNSRTSLKGKVIE